MRGGYRPGAGRKTEHEETKRYESMAKFLPQATQFIEWCFSDKATKDYKKWATELVLKKTIPDKKAVEVTGENGEPIRLNIIGGADYLSAIGKLTSSSATGFTGGSREIQSTDMAQTSEKNDNSNKSNSQVESA